MTQLGIRFPLPLFLSRPQPKAVLLGRACKVPEAYITNFSEESIRSQPSFMLSLLLRQLMPELRCAGGTGGIVCGPT